MGLSRLAGPLRDPGGFGLIELMIALTVLAIATVALTGVFVASHLTLRRASQSDAAAVLSDQLLERFRAETWDNIALNSSQVGTWMSDTLYPHDHALTDLPASPNNLAQDITDGEGLLAVDGTLAATDCGNSPEPLTCYPSRTEVGPDGNSYRLDTYVTWGCPDEAGETLGGTIQAPTCTDTSTGHVLAYEAVKVVTIVVRNATSSSFPVVYRTSTSFDRLGGGSMPTVTVTPPGSTTTTGTTTTGTTTTGTTTTGTTTGTGAPSPPSSVSFVNGVGTVSPCPCISSANEAGLSFDVQLPSTSLASDTLTLTLTDGNANDTVTYTASATQGSGIVHFTNVLDTNTKVPGNKLADGSITIGATASNSSGTSAPALSSTTKDTTAPTGLSVTSPANGATGVSRQGPFTGTAGTASGDVASVTVQFCQASTWTCGSSPTQSATAAVVSGGWSLTFSASSKLGNRKAYTMRVVQSDAAGNTAMSNDISFST